MRGESAPSRPSTATCSTPRERGESRREPHSSTRHLRGHSVHLLMTQPETANDRPAAEAADAAHDACDAFIRRIDARYQLLYSKVAAVALLAWLIVTILAFVAIDGWAVATLTGVGALLLTLFAMRTAVHLTGRALHDEVEHFLVARASLRLDDLVGRARQLEPRPAEFFVSLVDGPLARQRRQRATTVST